MAILYSRSVHTQPGLRRVLLLVLLYPLLCLCARITDVFTVAPETANGGCGNYIDANGDGALTDIWTDSIALNADALRLINAAISDDPARVPETQQARRLVATFFGTQLDYDEILGTLRFPISPMSAGRGPKRKSRYEARFSSQLKYANSSTKDWYNEVSAVLEGNAGANRYFLFCNGDYEVKKKSSDLAQNTQGNLLMDKVTTNKITIAQGFPDLDFRSFAPYWIQSAGIYVVDKKSHDPATYCSLQGSLGLTQHGKGNRAVLLCPNSFTTGPGKAQHVQLGTQVTDINQDIQDYSCIAMTFYHE